MDKIVDKVKKLLAMANDCSSPNEAITAARQARILMDKHQVSMGDLVESDGFSDSDSGINFINIPLWKSQLAVVVAKFNDCQSYFNCEVKEHKGKIKRVKIIMFRGFETDVAVAISMYEYIINTVERLARSYIIWHGVKGKNSILKNTYIDSCWQEIKENMYKIISEREVKTSTGKDLVVIKNQLVTERFGGVRYPKKPSKFIPTDQANVHAKVAGAKDGSNVGLDPQVKADRKNKIG